VSPDEYLPALKSALADYRFRDASQLGTRITPSEFDDRQVKTTLSLLRRKRQFAEIERMAASFFAAGNQAPFIRRQWAQAMLDQSRVPAGLDLLQKLLPEVAGSTEESEVQGLVGRANKQQFVAGGKADDLAAAIRAYTPFWVARKGDYRWHGINLVALVARGERDGLGLRSDLDAKAMARAIRDEIEDNDLGEAWDFAVALEASIALEDRAAAIDWLAKYVKHPSADAFEIGSTLRQLKEIWQLGTSRPELAAALLPPLECALLKQEGGAIESIEGSPPNVTDKAGFQSVYGSEAYIQVEWMDSLYQCCRAVARILHARTGKRLGTGYLVKGTDINPAWSAQPVLVTNAHVISADPADQAALNPQDARAEFTRLQGRPQVALGEIVYSSPKLRLDTTALRIDPPAEAAALEIAKSLPAVPAQGEAAERLFVIGHPLGGELAISLYDNHLVGYDGDFVRYRSPTEPGSSGSPVLSRDLAVVASHHRSRDDLQANEGICVTAIRTGACAAAKP